MLSMPEHSNVLAWMVGVAAGTSGGSQVLAGLELPLWIKLVLLLVVALTGD
jgi:hypothetical protein